MAYDASKDKQTTESAPGTGTALSQGNPYKALLTEEPPAAFGGAMPGGDSGASATGFVNFDRLYNANADVATREAGRLAGSAEGKAKGAVQGRAGAQQAFTGAMRAGAQQGPRASDLAKASTGEGFFKQDAGTTRAPDLSDGWTPPIPEADPTAINAGGVQDEAGWRASMERASKKDYEGPGSMSDMDSYAKLLQDTDAASDELGALQSNSGLEALLGGNETDAALLGAAGRPRFAQLGKQYGSLKGDLEKANAESAAQGDEARANAAAARKQYEALLKADAAREDDSGPAPIVMGAVPGAGGTSTVLGPAADADLGVLHDNEKKAAVYKDLGVVGESGSGEYAQAQNDLIKALGLTEQDMAMLIGMTTAERQAWLAKRKAEKGVQ